MKAMGGRTIPLIAKIFFFRLIHPEIFSQWKSAPEGYDPKPSYKIPKYEEWMKIPDFDMEKMYLRPTVGCECDAPEIVALAYKLGAHDLPEREYAENALKWVKNNIRFNIGGGTARETLREGMGVCIQQITMFITLCRTGGLKARYKVMVSSEIDPRMQELGIGISKGAGVDQVFGDFIYKMLTAFPGHFLAEVYLDGEWVNADPTFSDELEAGLGYRISKLGDEPEWISETGKVYYLEDSPRMGRPLLKWGKSFRGLQYIIDKGFEPYIEGGREILNLGEESYEERMKKSYEGLSKELSDMMKEI